MHITNMINTTILNVFVTEHLTDGHWKMSNLAGGLFSVSYGQRVVVLRECGVVCVRDD